MTSSVMPPWPFIAQGRTIEIASASGCHLVQKNGNRIFDAAGGAVVANIGHGRPEVADAVASSMRTMSYIVPPFLTPDREELVERLTHHWLPEHLSRVYFASGGSEAMDTAIRLSRQYHLAKGNSERTKVVGRKLSYHGTTVATLAIGGHDSRRNGFENFWNEMPRAPTPYPLRHHEVGEGECGADCAAALETLILEEGPETIAAFVAEPMIGSSGGAIAPPPSYWPAVQSICSKYGILLVIDEVMTGFGRTGTKFGVDQWDIHADILVSGKGLTAGYAPLVGVFSTEDVAQTLAGAGQTLMFYTYGGHPAACAAANAVLQIMDDEDLVSRAQKMGTILGEQLNSALGQHANVAEVRGRGLLWAVEIVKDRNSLEQFPIDAQITNKVVAAGLSNGFMFYPGGTGTVRDIIVMGPPYILTEDDISQMVTTLSASISSVMERTT